MAALAGALGAALAAMVANLAHPKSSHAHNRDDLEAVAVEGQQIKQRLLDAIDDDTWAFEKLMEAGKVPKGEREARLRDATFGAARVPLSVAESCPRIVELCAAAARLGMKASLSDAGVGAAMARAAAIGAAFNVRINLKDMADDPEAAAMIERADRAVAETERGAGELEAQVWADLGRP